MKIVTLVHELIHAYMYSVLETNGQITFDINGDPILNVNCNNGVNYNNVNLNGLSINDRFDVLICAMNQNNTLSSQWTHDLFNSTVFDVNTYRQKLETLIFNEYDWTSENINFKNDAINLFGNNWKQEISKAVSWLGLENTAEYNTYYNTYNTNPQKQLYIALIKTKITNSNNNCQ